MEVFYASVDIEDPPLISGFLDCCICEVESGAGSLSRQSFSLQLRPGGFQTSAGTQEIA
jgi:hypothetical protein